jgi:hypothetical protein
MGRRTPWWRGWVATNSQFCSAAKHRYPRPPLPRRRQSRAVAVFGRRAAEGGASILQETGLRPDLLELEAIENILLDDDELALSIFQRIQALGVHIASDIRTG